MSDFKLCENGHYYPQSLHECPYCPKSSTEQGLIPQDGGGGGSGGESNQEDDFMMNQFARTIANSHDATQIFTGGSNDLNKTQVFGNQGFDNMGTGFSADFQPTTPSTGRKMVGWLVSFTIDPNGTDFKLYEGRNSVGADPGCDVVIPHDPAVSARHLTILHRMGHFKFKDELSTNGTFINDVFEEEGNLKDGDIIRMGDTIFKFRSIA